MVYWNGGVATVKHYEHRARFQSDMNMDPTGEFWNVLWAILFNEHGQQVCRYDINSEYLNSEGGVG